MHPRPHVSEQLGHSVSDEFSLYLRPQSPGTETMRTERLPAWDLNPNSVEGGAMAMSLGETATLPDPSIVANMLGIMGLDTNLLCRDTVAQAPTVTEADLKFVNEATEVKQEPAVKLEPEVKEEQVSYISYQDLAAQNSHLFVFNDDDDESF